MKHAKNNKSVSTATDSRKTTREQIQAKLREAFTSFMPVLGEKKFNKRIKKAGKVLSHNLKGTIINKSSKYVSARAHNQKVNTQ